MTDIRKFTDAILMELAARMKASKSPNKLQKEMVSLEALTRKKENASKRGKHFKTEEVREDGKRNIVTQKDVEGMGDIRELAVASNAIITPLAKEIIKKKKINLIIK